MTAFSRIASLLSLAAIAHADESTTAESRNLTIEIIETWDSTAAELYIGTESIEYNADDDLWYVANWYCLGTGAASCTNVTDKTGEIGSLSGDYPVTTTTDFGLMEDIMDEKASTNPAGMVYHDGFLFIADIAAGVVHKFDTSTNTYVDNVETGPIANGLCMDYDNDTLYATNTGWDFNTGSEIPSYSGLWSIDPETLEATRLYDGSASTFPDATNPDGSVHVFAPNGCYVNEGSVYMVDVQLRNNSLGSLGVYNIESGAFTRDTEVLAAHPVCDGIVYYDGYWFVSDVGQGQLLALDTKEEGAIFEMVLENMDGAADICLGPDNTIAIPSTSGTIYFAQFCIGDEDCNEDDSSAARVGIFSALAIIVAALV